MVIDRLYSCIEEKKINIMRKEKKMVWDAVLLCCNGALKSTPFCYVVMVH